MQPKELVIKLKEGTTVEEAHTAIAIINNVVDDELGKEVVEDIETVY